MKRKKTKNLVQPDVIEELVELRYIKFLHLIRTLLIEIENTTDKKTRKSIFREILYRFLETYSGSVPTLRTKSVEIKKYFGRPELQFGNDLNECVDDMLKFFLDVQDKVRNIEDFRKFVVSRLLCTYIVLAETDARGSNMCTSFCKELVGKRNWKENTPKRYTFECLGDGHQDTIKRCRFWQKWSREFHDPIF